MHLFQDMLEKYKGDTLYQNSNTILSQWSFPIDNQRETPYVTILFWYSIKKLNGDYRVLMTHLWQHLKTNTILSEWHIYYGYRSIIEFDIWLIFSHFNCFFLKFVSFFSSNYQYSCDFWHFFSVFQLILMIYTCFVTVSTYFFF